MKALVILGFVVSVYSAGLNEEFTWSRIDYAWPQAGRFGEGRGYRPKYGNPIIVGSGGSDFMFPGNINEPNRKKTTTTSTQTPSVGGGNVEDVDYIYQNNVPMGANRWKDKLFITVPRRRMGVPSTLNYVPIDSKNKHNVPLIPYPNWEVNQLNAPETDRIVSVYRIAIDPCDRLWLVDTGIIETLGNRTDIQPHRIVIIDLKTDKIINKYTLKSSDLRPATVLALIQVDVTADTCDNAYAYMPDLAGFGLVVYSLKDNNSWRVNHNYFYLEPTAGDFNIGGHSFQWNDGVFSVALSDMKSDGFRDLYFHSMAGRNLYMVSTRILRNETLATRSNHGNDFVIVGDRGPLSQTSATDLHKPTGVLFFSLVNQNALGCWNTNKQFLPENFDIVQKNDEKMIYPCDLKIYQNDVILLTNNMPIFLYGRLNYDQTNFRVWMNNVREAVKGTSCNL